MNQFVMQRNRHITTGLSTRQQKAIERLGRLLRQLPEQRLEQFAKMLEADTTNEEESQ